MTGDMVERHLHTEELYQKLMHVVYTPDRTDDINPDDMRRVLDAILSAGKIEGRLLSHTVHGTPVQRTGDRFIEQWQCIVDSVPVEKAVPKRGDTVHFPDRQEIVYEVDGDDVRLCNLATIRASSLVSEVCGAWRFTGGVS